MICNGPISSPEFAKFHIQGFHPLQLVVVVGWFGQEWSLGEMVPTGRHEILDGPNVGSPVALSGRIEC